MGTWTMTMQVETSKGCSGFVRAEEMYCIIRSPLVLLPTNLPVHQETSAKGHSHFGVGVIIKGIAQVLKTCNS